MKDNYITKELRKEFPKLEYWNSRQTSEATTDYNCIAWALGINKGWVWPYSKDKSSNNILWPNALDAMENKSTFIKLFQLYGYKIVPDKNRSLQSFREKIAIYVDTYNRPTHAARQLSNGKWTSKIGKDMDIEHDDLEVLEGPAYGKADIIMAREHGHFKRSMFPSFLKMN